MPEERTTSSTGGQKGVKLQRFDLIPVGPLVMLAEHFGRGARKYEDHQWRNGYELSKSYASIQRHSNAFWRGEDYDVCSNEPDGCSFVTHEGEPYVPVEDDTCYNHTGSHHMIAVAWHSFVIIELQQRFPEHDDRYKPGDQIDIERMHPLDRTSEKQTAVFVDHSCSCHARIAGPCRACIYLGCKFWNVRTKGNEG